MNEEVIWYNHFTDEFYLFVRHLEESSYFEGGEGIVRWHSWMLNKDVVDLKAMGFIGLCYL